MSDTATVSANCAECSWVASVRLPLRDGDQDTMLSKAEARALREIQDSLADELRSHVRTVHPRTTP